MRVCGWQISKLWGVGVCVEGGGGGGNLCGCHDQYNIRDDSGGEPTWLTAS